MIVCAGRNETFDFAKEMGVGLIETAINLTKECLVNKPEFILFVGSAGSYGNHDIFDIIESKKSSNIELSSLNGDSFSPINNIIQSETDFTQSDIIVNSSNYISTNAKLTNLYNKDTITCENMEFYSILQVANKFSIPASGIFVITNYTNNNAHHDFIKNHKSAMKVLIDYLQYKKLVD